MFLAGRCVLFSRFVFFSRTSAVLADTDLFLGSVLLFLPSYDVTAGRVLSARKERLSQRPVPWTGENCRYMIG